jgi:hypothetical protein
VDIMAFRFFVSQQMTYRLRAKMVFTIGPDVFPATGDLGEGNGVWDAHEPVDPTAIDMRTEGSYAFMVATAFPFQKTFVGHCGQNIASAHWRLHKFWH